MNVFQRRHVHEAMVQLAEGRRAAFDAVFAGLWPELLSFVRRAMPGHPDADDLAQQTLLRIFFRISEFDTSRDGVAWAFGIAIYEVRTLRRTRQRRQEIVIDAAIPTIDRSPSPEKLLIETDLRQALSDALGELTESDRAVLLPGDDQIVSVSPDTWRKRRQRALERLRAVWRSRNA
jgi:RNA polymerase sigma-70 factor (ECF subfamily)